MSSCFEGRRPIVGIFDAEFGRFGEIGSLSITWEESCCGSVRGPMCGLMLACVGSFASAAKLCGQFGMVVAV